ncbi:MAG: aminotransferase class I/II-fold pyridoxal phosphate-dependent enzyme [Fusicatenibacter sp.]|nr:aminotransferase class I/II-fold pyridoxal phosphate-dependent enzyme [Lachnospiraceae bacterium]MDY2938640.1 aminotransferase class I/II-fold pyridoxal phosphate-dependent enzyme [Fusicatenibacter sp.]
MQFSKRMDHFGENIFTVLLNRKQEKESAGEKVIDLSVGTPNIPPAKHVIDALTSAAADEKNYVYAIKDTSELDDAVAIWYERRYQVKINPRTQVVSLLGSQEGLAHFALAVADPGDTVLVPDPCYPVFGDGPLIAGAELYPMPLRKEKNYLIDFDEIPEEIAKKAKLMVVSYPNNPTAAIAPGEFYEKLVAFAKKYDIMVLHDNAYSELVFDTEPTGSFLATPGAMDVGVEFNSLSKTYGLAGARIGFCIGNEQIVAMLAKLKSNMDYGMFLPIQKAAIAAITGDQSCVKDTRDAYRRRRDCLCEGLTSIGWEVEKSPATMFVWAKIPDGFTSSEEFVTRLLEESGVLVTPGNAFGASGEGYVRIALVKEEPEIQEAIAKIRDCGILKEKM